MELALTEYRATYRVTAPYWLPWDSGDRFRGLLGKALLAVGCGDPDGCQDAACPYHALFKPPLAARDFKPLIRKGVKLPSPLIPLTPMPACGLQQEGTQFQVGLRLIGTWGKRVHQLVQDALRGLDPMHLVAETVERCGAREQVWDMRADGLNPCREATLHLVTPMRWDAGGKLRAAPAFELLFSRFHARCRRLASVYGRVHDDHEEWFDRLRGQAGRVRIQRDHIEPIKWLRDPRGKAIPVTALIGEATYAGPISGAVPLLQASEYLNIGRDILYGLGAVSWTFEMEPIKSP